MGGDHRKFNDAINVRIIWIHLVKILSGYSATMDISSLAILIQ